METNVQEEFTEKVVGVKSVVDSLFEDLESGLTTATKAEISPRIDEIIDVLVDVLKPAYDKLPKE